MGDPDWKKLQKLRDELDAKKAAKKLFFPADSKIYFDKAANEKLAAEKIWAPPFDARFPQQNQTNHCWFYYIDYHRCKNLKGEDYDPCNYLKEVYTCMCPGSWTARWDTWIEEGRFPCRIDR